MDILNVLGLRVNAVMQDHLYNINCILANPEEKDAVDRLQEHIEGYVKADSQLELLRKFSEQMKEEQEANNED